MKKIFHFLATHHVLGNVLAIMILLVGITIAMAINKELFPRIKFNKVMINTPYPFASPEDVELNITNKIEKKIKGIDGVKNIFSTSAEGLSLITVNLDDNLKKNKINEVVSQLWEGAVTRVKDFPENLEEKPMVYRLSGNFIPVLTIGLSGSSISYEEKRRYAKEFEKKLYALPGVATIERIGFETQQIAIEVQPEKLKTYHITLEEIYQAILNRNVRGTAGILESYSGSKSVVLISQFKTMEEVGNTIIRTTFSSPVVRVKDVAVIKKQFSKSTTESRINGEEVISFQILKKEEADIVETTDAIKQFMASERKHLPKGIELLYANDLSRYVKASFKVVMSNGLTGFLLVFIVLTFFLSWRIAFWVALGIPISLFGTIALLPMFNVHLDILTLASMILVIGIIVDDAIVVAESIHQHWEKGLSPIQAVINGINDVFWPVCTTVATTLLAFLPMFFIPGDIGKFVRVIPLVIASALSFSLIESITILPSHVAHGLDKSKSKQSGKTKKKFSFSGLQTLYGKILRSLLQHKIKTSLVFALITIMIIGISAFHLKFELFPSKGAEEFQIYIETSGGDSITRTTEKVAALEKLIHKLPKGEIASFVTTLGSQNDGFIQSNLASIAVNLTPFSTRQRSADAIVNELRSQSSKLKGFTKLLYDVSDSGPNPQKPIALRLVGENDWFRTKLADDIIAFLKKRSTIKDIERDDRKGKERINVHVDPAVLPRYGLSPSEVSKTLRIIYKGLTISQTQSGNETIKYVLQFPKKYQTEADALFELTVANNKGQLIPLKTIARFESLPDLANYKHFNGERVINIQANAIGSDKLQPEQVIADVVNNFNLHQDYPGCRIIVAGATQQKKQSLKQLGRVFSYAFVGIYLLLVLLFNSYKQPFLVLTALPFGLLGVFVVFMIHNEPLSFMSALGIIGLTGVVVNDSLLMIHTINASLANQPEENQINLIVQGATKRLRAILLTTITTVAGLLPLAYGLGGQDPTTAPMALALGWGLFIATPLILFMLPVLYAMSLKLNNMVFKPKGALPLK